MRRGAPLYTINRFEGDIVVTKVWDDPAVFCILVNLPQNPLWYLNVYVIVTPEQNLVIDTGFNRMECREVLWNGIRELNLDLRKTSVFLTRLHSDHTGLAEDFVLQGCPIYMGRIDYCYLKGMKAGNHLSAVEELFRQEGFPAEQLARQGLENQERRYSVAQMFPVLLVDDGSIIRLGDLEVRCIHTPGHTPGHMVLYLPKEQLLFSGDHILFDITPNIAVWNGVPHSLEDYLASLDKIRNLNIRGTFPAHRHGEAGVYQCINILQEHHWERLEEIRQAVENHPETTAYQIAGLISWSTWGLGWNQFPPHQKWFAMGETLAHLWYLRDHGQVLRNEESESVRYCSIGFKP